MGTTNCFACNKFVETYKSLLFKKKSVIIITLIFISILIQQWCFGISGGNCTSDTKIVYNTVLNFFLYLRKKLINVFSKKNVLVYSTVFKLSSVFHTVNRNLSIYKHENFTLSVCAKSICVKEVRTHWWHNITLLGLPLSNNNTKSEHDFISLTGLIWISKCDSLWDKNRSWSGFSNTKRS